MLVVGGGSIGERHVRCFLGTGRVRVDLCEANPERCREVAGCYSLERSYTDLEAVPRDLYAAAVVATPAHLHVEMAIRLARGGAHLLIEKPLSTRLDGVEELVRTVAERGSIAAVAYVWRAHPALARMKAAIAAGRFGAPVQIVAVSGQHFPTYRPAYREIYYRDRKRGGGAVQDALTHLVNAGEWLVGPVERLVADAGHQALEGVEVEDTVHVIARHGEVMGSYSLNQHQAPNESTISVVGERGTARFELHDNSWSWTSEPGADWRTEPGDVPERDTLFIVQANGFLDAVEGRGRPICSLEDGLQTLRVNLAILESVETGRWVTVDE